MLQTIEESLCQRHLMTALQAMKSYALKMQDTQYYEILQSIEENYGFLLSYYAAGKNDPMRDEVLCGIYRSAFSIFDIIRRTKKFTTKPAKDILRKAEAITQEAEDPHNLKQLFYATWTGKYLTKKDAESLDSDQLCVWASALTLRLLDYFHEDHFLLLLQIADTPYPEAGQRILTGIFLIYLRYYNRLFCYPDILKELQKLCRNKQLQKELRKLSDCILNTYLTPQVDKVMESLQQDILPTLHNKDHHIVITLDDSDEANPEWGEELNKAMHKHIGEMSKLHEQGGDFNYASTRAILNNVFFQEDPANFFIPFREDNQELNINFASTEGKLLRGLMRANADACDVDKYALCLIYRNIAKESFTQQLPEVFKELGTLANDDNQEAYHESNYAQNYIRCLYRYFNNNPMKDDNALLLYNKLPETGIFPHLYDESHRQEFGDKCLAYKLYPLAEQVFVDNNGTSLQKKGFALQKQNRFEEALNCYQLALLSSDDEWTLHHIAVCLRHLNRTEEAINTYMTLAERFPDNPTYLRQQAQCLLALNRYDEALQTFFKLDILFPDKQSKRGVGWCAFLCGKTDIAEQYLEQLAFDADATDNDLLNYAHLLLATSHREEAVNIYVKLAKRLDKPSDFIQRLHADTPLLLSKEVSLSDLALMEDAVLHILNT